MDYHDTLALFGAGSAHPGGFAATARWMDSLPVSPGIRVLEVGCGTGRTACALAERFDADVTGIDIRPAMIDKARARAKSMGLAVDFQVSKKGTLPFADASFDGLVAESVTVFNPVGRMLREYLRTLRPGGWLLDTEMASAAPLPPEILRVFQAFYGAREVPTLAGWKRQIAEAGFQNPGIVVSGPVENQVWDAGADDNRFDAHSCPSPEAYGDEALAVVRENGRIMAEYGKWLCYGVFRGERPGRDGTPSNAAVLQPRRSAG